MSESKKISIVDDSREILDSVAMLLHLEGYDVSTYDKGSDLIKNMYFGMLPDVILLDLYLSNEDGREICTKIKSDQKLRDIPVVMMSANTDMENDALKCGADAFIPKPFEMNDVLRKMKLYAGY